MKKKAQPDRARAGDPKVGTNKRRMPPELGSTDFPCEICGHPAHIPHVPPRRTGIEGAFGDLADASGLDPAPKAEEGEAKRDTRFWACRPCHEKVRALPKDELQRRVRLSRLRHPSPASAVVVLRRPGPEILGDLLPEVEEAVGVTASALADLLLLDSLKGLGPQKFKQLHESGIAPREVIDNPSRLPTQGRRGHELRLQLGRLPDDSRKKFRGLAEQVLVAAFRHDASILTYSHPYYPKNLYESNNAVPLLYARGTLETLGNRKSVACVGSRGIRPPYSARHEGFARVVAENDGIVVSGFATGADAMGHRAALEAGRGTILVMPCGLDSVFPPENRDLWQALMARPGAVAVSEFRFGVRASNTNLKRRNKTIVALARGVLVSQSAVDGGAMNAFHFALEQRKPLATFEPDHTEETSGNRRIATEKKVPVTVFPSGRDARELYEAWLRQLFSSI